MNSTRRRQPSRLAQFWESSYTRVAVALLLFVAGYVLLLVYFINSYTERLYEVRREEMRRIVELGLAALDPLRGADDGLRSMEQQRRDGAIALRDLSQRYRLGENYLFMGTTSGLILVYPYEPDIEFTNQYDMTDPNGVPIVQQMIAIAGSDAGAGYLEYYEPPPNSNVPQRKVSYVVSIPEWDAFIGAGMYMGELDAQNARYVQNSLLLTAGLVLLIFLVVFVALNPTLSSYQTLLNLFEQVREEPERIPEVPVNRFRDGSEAWTLLATFEDMLEQVEENKHIRQEAALAERNRLARELHDAVSQTLFSATIIADVLPRLWERDSEVARERLQELRELTRGALAEMRTLLNELRPSALVQTSFEDLLRQLVDAVVARSRLPIELEIEGEYGGLAPDVKIALYRIAQEALNNIVKHAHATAAEIELTQNGHDGVRLCIRDEGRGFRPAAVSSDHLGLSIMRERAEAIGAALSVNTEPGGGTEVVVRWPADL